MREFIVSHASDVMLGFDWKKFIQNFGFDNFNFEKELLGSGVSGIESCRTREDGKGLDWDTILEFIWYIIDNEGDCDNEMFKKMIKFSTNNYELLTGLSDSASDWRNDCFLGLYSVSMAAVVCYGNDQNIIENDGNLNENHNNNEIHSTMSQNKIEITGEFLQLFRFMSTNTEAFFYLLNNPVAQTYFSYWPITKLWRLVRLKSVEIFKGISLNSCDIIDTHIENEFFENVNENNFQKSENNQNNFKNMKSKANNFLTQNYEQFAYKSNLKEEDSDFTDFDLRACPFAYVVAVLISGLSDDFDSDFGEKLSETNSKTSKLSKTNSNNTIILNSQILQTIQNASQLLASWGIYRDIEYHKDHIVDELVEQKQFHLDLFTGRFPVFDFFPEYQRPEHIGEFPIKVAQLEQKLLQKTKKIQVEKINNSKLRNLKILFLGGGDQTFRFSSFGTRARQMARSLRTHHGVDAVAWNEKCDNYCEEIDNGHKFVADVVIHLKSLCECALNVLENQVAHILDPISFYEPNLYEPMSNSQLADAILVQTQKSIEIYDQNENFTFYNETSYKKVPAKVFLFPHHHSNFADFKSDYQILKKSKIKIGTHTAHFKSEMLTKLSNYIIEKYDDEKVKFFVNNINWGRNQYEDENNNNDKIMKTDTTIPAKHAIITAFQTQVVHYEMSNLDIIIVTSSCHGIF